MAGAFRSLKIFNYRLWAGDAIVSNVGAWMQRTAQDWIVLTQLTHASATAVGVVIALISPRTRRHTDEATLAPSRSAD